MKLFLEFSFELTEDSTFNKRIATSQKLANAAFALRNDGTEFNWLGYGLSSIDHRQDTAHFELKTLNFEQLEL